MKSCLVLTAESVRRLHKVAHDLRLPIFDGGQIICHHLTLSFDGEIPKGYVEGNKYKMFISEYGISDKAIAFFVDPSTAKGCESGNPHITFSIAQGANPIDSLDICEFRQFTGLEVEGVFASGEKCFFEKNT